MMVIIGKPDASETRLDAFRDRINEDELDSENELESMIDPDGQQIPLNTGNSMREKMLPTLQLMRLLGFFPSVDICGCQNPSALSTKIRNYLLLLYYCIIFCILVIISRLTVLVTNQYRIVFGILNAVTFSGLIIGLKPLICCSNFIFLNFAYQAHRRLLEKLGNMERNYQKDFGCVANTKKLNWIFYTCAAVSFLVALTLRMIEFFWRNQSLGQDFIDDIGILAVSMINVLVTQPVVYFYVVYSLVYHYTQELQRAIQSRIPLSGQQMNQMYYRFIELTECQSAVSDFFGPWIFVSLGWCVLSLCLTIYFVTQTQTDLFSLPNALFDGLPQEFINDLYLLLIFNCTWSLMQITVVCIYFGVFFVLGATINEESRRIISILLSKLPTNPTDKDRFIITCFAQKMSMQFQWGVTIWRSFAIERGSLLTITSLIFTYAILLLKLKAVKNVSEIEAEQLSIENVTSAIANITLNLKKA